MKYKLCLELTLIDSHKSWKTAYVNLLIWERNSAGGIVSLAKAVNVVTNLPNTRSIKGRRVPAAMAVTMAITLRNQLIRSAYLNTRYFKYIRSSMNEQDLVGPFTKKHPKLPLFSSRFVLCPSKRSSLILSPWLLNRIGDWNDSLLAGEISCDIAKTFSTLWDGW